MSLTVGASAASASTFFVNGATGADTHACTSPGEPCKTIKAAVEKSEEAPGAATIEVAVGVYQEEVNLSHPADNGIVVNGAGNSTVIEGPAVKAENATVLAGGPTNVETLSNLSVVNPVGDAEDGIEAGANVTLNNVSVDMQNAGGGVGIVAGAFGSAASVTINGGSVTMESGATGDAIENELGPLSIGGMTVTVADGATGTGIASLVAPTSLTNMAVNLGNKASGGIVTQYGSASLENVAIKADSGSTSIGMENIFASAVSGKNVTVTLENPAGTNPAIIEALDNATFDHLQVAGAWKGLGLIAQGANLTLADTRIVTGPEATGPAAVFVASGEGRGLLLQRSVLQSPPTAEGGDLIVAGSNATIDSSELLGNKIGVALSHEESKTRTLTIAGSTIDAGVLGERDSGEVFDVAAEAKGKASIANANVEGSILFERQKAIVGAGGNAANVTCSYADAPNQTQTVTGTEGSIACANGASGNTTTEPLSSLFGAPITSYGLLPGSSAIDSVPASAISLPFGLTPSATDLAGNPRVVDGNLDCVAVQDKGALELQGFAKACPPPPPPPVVLASIANLSIAPNALYAAPSGATISKAHKKRKYGATISWRDSLAATTTFTVIRETSGRKQGKSCKKPSKRNKHGKRCTILTAIGSFTHVDVAGANKAHFSGRLNGKKLAKGRYVLQAVPHNAAGNGKAVKRQFKIKG